MSTKMHILAKHLIQSLGLDNFSCFQCNLTSREPVITGIFTVVGAVLYTLTAARQEKEHWKCQKLESLKLFLGDFVFSSSINNTKTK